MFLRHESGRAPGGWGEPLPSLQPGQCGRRGLVRPGLQPPRPRHVRQPLDQGAVSQENLRPPVASVTRASTSESDDAESTILNEDLS